MFNYQQLPEDEIEYVTVARVSELGSGQRILFEIDGQPMALFNVAGRYLAIADVCTHDDGPVGEGELEGTQITCPRHGARFDLTTGKALSLPAVVDIPSYPVRLRGEEIQLGLPRTRP